MNVKAIQNFLNTLKISPRDAVFLLKKFSAEEFSYNIQRLLKEDTPRTLFQFLLEYQDGEFAKYALAKMRIEHISAQYQETAKTNPSVRKPFALSLAEAERLLLDSEAEVMALCRETPLSGVDLSVDFFTRYYDKPDWCEAFIQCINEVHTSLTDRRLLAPQKTNALIDCLKEIQRMQPADRSLVNIIESLHQLGNKTLLQLQLNLIKIVGLRTQSALIGEENEHFLLSCYQFCIHILYLRAEFALRGSLDLHMDPYIDYCAQAFERIKDKLSHVPMHLQRFVSDYFYVNMRYYFQHPKHNFHLKYQNLYTLCQETTKACETITEPLSKIALLQISLALLDRTRICDPEAPIILGERIQPIYQDGFILSRQKLDQNVYPLTVGYVSAFLIKCRLESFCLETLKRPKVPREKKHKFGERVAAFIQEAANLFEQHILMLSDIGFQRPNFLTEGHLYHDTLLNPRFAALCLLDMLEQIASNLLLCLETESLPFQQNLDAIHKLVRTYLDSKIQTLNLPEMERLQWRKHQAFVQKAERAYKLFIDCSRLRNILNAQHFFDLKRPALRNQQIEKTKTFTYQVLRWSGAFQGIRLVLDFTVQHTPLFAVVEASSSTTQTSPSHNKKRKAKNRHLARVEAKPETNHEVSEKQEEPSTPEEGLSLYEIAKQDKALILKLCAQHQFVKARRHLETLYPKNQTSFGDLQAILTLTEFWAQCQQQYGALAYFIKETFSRCSLLQEKIIRDYPKLAKKIGLTEYKDFREMVTYYEGLEEQGTAQTLLPITAVEAFPKNARTNTEHPALQPRTKSLKSTDIKADPSKIHFKRMRKDWLGFDICSKETQEIFKKLENAGLRFFIFGGWVRDTYLGKTAKDIDILVFASWQNLQECFGPHTFIKTSKKLPLGQIFLENAEPLDVLYLPPVQNESELNTVLRERYYHTDLTCNSLMYDWVRKTLIYEQSALQDIEQGLLKLPKERDARAHFGEDPIRMWRVLYFKLKLGFQIEASLEKNIQDYHGLLEEVNEDRRFIEFQKLCSQDYLGALKLLHAFHFHTLACLRPLSPTLIARLESIPHLQEKMREKPHAYLAILHAEAFLAAKQPRQNTDIYGFICAFLADRGIFKRPESQWIHYKAFIEIWSAYKNYVSSEPHPGADCDFPWLAELAKACRSSTKTLGLRRFSVFQDEAMAHDITGENHHHFLDEGM